MAEDPRDPGKIARDAALQSLVSNAVYLVLMLGVTVAITKRDALTRMYMRVVRTAMHDPRKVEWRKALADFLRELSEIEHGMNVPERPAETRETPGGLYGQR